MTILKARETRAGKKISKKNLQKLANIHHALKAVAADANVDLDDIPPEGLGGDDGTLGGSGASDSVVANDGTGVASRMITPPIRRGGSHHLNVETRTR